MFFLLVLLVGLVALLVYNYLHLKKDILAPPVVMTVMFILGTLFALLNVGNWSIKYSFLASFYILTGIIIFSLPMYAAERRFAPVTVRITARPLRIALWKIAFATVLSLFIILLYHLEMVAMAERAGYDGNSLQWFIRNTTSYKGAMEFSGFTKLIVRFIDITAYIFMFTFINNKLVYKQKGRADYLLLIPILLFVYKTAMTGGRLDVMRLAFAGIVQMYILEKAKYGWNAPISKKYILTGAVGVLVGLPAFYYGLFLVGRSTSRSLFQTASTYLGGPIQHFNQYVQNPVKPSPYFGSETLTPILNILGDLGIIDYAQTVHLEYRKLGVSSGNVYTFFRRPLQDFGVIGMYLFVAAISAFFAYYYYKVIRSNKRKLHWDIQVMIYSYLFHWVILASIEQYSMVVISLFTLIGLALFYVLAVFYWKIDIDIMRKKIIIKHTDREVR